MRAHSLLHYAYATVTSIALLGLGSAAYAQNLPSYMEPITGRTSSSPAGTATKNVLALNTGMFELYGDAGQIFKRNLLSKHPVILALFSGAGGRFILYRPGQEPLEAPSVPIVYQLLKSIGHSTMALSQVVAPYLDNPTDQSWRSPMLAYRSRMKSALDGLDVTPMPAEWRDNNRILLENNLAFVDECLAKGHHLFRRAGGILQEAGALLEAERRVGRADPGRPLDARARRLEGDARQRLG
jgi:hypothetical protein